MHKCRAEISHIKAAHWTDPVVMRTPIPPIRHSRAAPATDRLGWGAVWSTPADIRTSFVGVTGVTTFCRPLRPSSQADPADTADKWASGGPQAAARGSDVVAVGGGGGGHVWAGRWDEGGYRNRPWTHMSWRTDQISTK